MSLTVNKMTGTGGSPNYLNTGNSAKKFSVGNTSAPEYGFLSISKRYTLSLKPVYIKATVKR